MNNEMNFNPETTTCVFAHPNTEQLYFCEHAPQGMTRDLNQATKYMGAASRTRGMEIVKDKYPNIKDGDLIFYYLIGM